MLAIPNKTHHGLFIELKSEKGKLSEKQLEMRKILSANGYQVSVCFSIEEAINTVKCYLGVLFNVRSTATSKPCYSTCPASNEPL